MHTEGELDWSNSLPHVKKYSNCARELPGKRRLVFCLPMDPAATIDALPPPSSHADVIPRPGKDGLGRDGFMSSPRVGKLLRHWPSESIHSRKEWRTLLSETTGRARPKLFPASIVRNRHPIISCRQNCPGYSFPLQNAGVMSVILLESGLESPCRAVVDKRVAAQPFKSRPGVLDGPRSTSADQT
jgi:hypothetical protein